MFLFLHPNRNFSLLLSVPQFAVKPVEGFFVYEGGLRVENRQGVKGSAALYGVCDELQPQRGHVDYVVPSKPRVCHHPCYISAGGSPLVFDLFAGRLVP